MAHALKFKVSIKRLIKKGHIKIAPKKYKNSPKKWQKKPKKFKNAPIKHFLENVPS